MRVYPVILAGGSGQRLWPISRPEEPKPFLRRGATTLFIDSLRRVAAEPGWQPPLVVTGRDLVALAGRQIEEAGIEEAVILAEPVARNTAAAVTAAALAILRADPGGIVHVLPSDQAIADPAAYRAAVRSAAELGGTGRLVLIGVRPDRPATAYGYIVPGEVLAERAFSVDRFAEKPDADAADRLIARDAALWNTGTITARADVIVAAAHRHAGTVAMAADRALARATAADGQIWLDAEAYADAPAGSFDALVLERTANLAVLRVRFDWADLGTWPSIMAGSASDADGNVRHGPGAAVGTRDSLVVSAGPRVVVVGCTGLAVLADRDAVLVTPLDDLEDGPPVGATGTDTGDPSGETEQDRAATLSGTRLVDAEMIALAPGQSRTVAPRAAVARHLIAIDGPVDVIAGSETDRIGHGRSYFVPADKPHELRNRLDRPVSVCVLTVLAPGMPPAAAASRSLPAPAGLDAAHAEE